MTDSSQLSNLIDTHCHLTHARLRKNTSAVLARARTAGVAAVICVATDLNESSEALDLAGSHEKVYCTAGVHPHEARDVAEGYLDSIEQLAGNQKNVAIGEIGLDFHYDFSPREIQRRIFGEQLELARQLNKPVIVHMREAFEDTMAILNASGVDGRRVVFHSFSGGTEEVGRVLDFGAAVSFSGMVTFRKADAIKLSARLVPDDRLLIETDSPYLSPEPIRKIKTNEPANVRHVAACLAELRGTAVGRVAELTYANATAVFHLDRI